MYIIEFGKVTVTFTRGKATLNALNRALAAYPDRSNLPDIEFVLTTEDCSRGESPVWTYSKRDDEDGVWLMPDFAYWSWPEVNIGPYKEIRQRIVAVDDGGVTAKGKKASGLKFKDKKKQLFWRGSIATNEELRGKLIQASSGKSWSSVRGIDWGNPDDVRENLLPMEDHCRYMFLAHLEGRSFSGRGKYLLNCRSVFVSHRLTWREAHHAVMVSSGPDANFVEVDRDFADLDRKMRFLLDNPGTAEKIANNAVRTLRDRYLTPAAESCYWRHLIRQYASACDFEPQLFEFSRKSGEKTRGVPFESWILNAP